ncbi:hypothetical protein ACTL6U_16160 [Rhodovibrionaceae bacterium A322]
MPKEPPLTFRFSLPRLVIYSASLVVMALFGVGLILEPNTTGWAAILAPAFLLLISAMALVIMVKQLKFLGQDIVTIGPEGLLDRRISDQPISWDHIIAAEVKKASLTKTLIVVKDDKKTIDMDFILLNGQPHVALLAIQEELSKK